MESVPKLYSSFHHVVHCQSVAFFTRESHFPYCWNPKPIIQHTLLAVLLIRGEIIVLISVHRGICPSLFLCQFYEYLLSNNLQPRWNTTDFKINNSNNNTTFFPREPKRDVLEEKPFTFIKRLGPIFDPYRFWNAFVSPAVCKYCFLAFNQPSCSPMRFTSFSTDVSLQRYRIRSIIDVSNHIEIVQKFLIYFSEEVANFVFPSK